MRKKNACIITGGTISKDFLSKHLKEHSYSLLLVVDGALELTHSLNIQPDYIVGDFDTVSEELLQFYGRDIILRHPPQKDQTDTELAVEIAIRFQCKEIDFLGATGTRLDHSLANIFLLQRLLRKGISGVLWDAYNKLYLKGETFQLKKQEAKGDFFSLLPLTQTVEQVTLTGVKYPVKNRTFYREDTLGISNEIIEDEASIEFAKGIFIVVESKDNEG